MISSHSAGNNPNAASKSSNNGEMNLQNSYVSTPSPPPAAAAAMAGMNSDLPIDLQLQKQIEFYFSQENLSKDTFMIENMLEDGFIPIPIIAGFRRVKNITTDISLVVKALQGSQICEVDVARNMVRARWTTSLPHPINQNLLNMLVPPVVAPPAYAQMIPQSISPLQVQQGIHVAQPTNHFVVIDFAPEVPKNAVNEVTKLFEKEANGIKTTGIIILNGESTADKAGTPINIQSWAIGLHSAEDCNLAIQHLTSTRKEYNGYPISAYIPASTAPIMPPYVPPMPQWMPQMQPPPMMYYPGYPYQQQPPIYHVQPQQNIWNPSQHGGFPQQPYRKGGNSSGQGYQGSKRRFQNQGQYQQGNVANNQAALTGDVSQQAAYSSVGAPVQQAEGASIQKNENDAQISRNNNNNSSKSGKHGGSSARQHKKHSNSDGNDNQKESRGQNQGGSGKHGKKKGGKGLFQKSGNNNAPQFQLQDFPSLPTSNQNESSSKTTLASNQSQSWVAVTKAPPATNKETNAAASSTTPTNAEKAKASNAEQRSAQNSSSEKSDASKKPAQAQQVNSSSDDETLESAISSISINEAENVDPKHKAKEASQNASKGADTSSSSQTASSQSKPKESKSDRRWEKPSQPVVAGSTDAGN